MKLITKDLSPTVKLLLSIAILMTSISFASLFMSFLKDYPLLYQAIGTLFMFGLSSWICIKLFIKDFKTNFSKPQNTILILWAIILPIAIIPLNDFLTFEGQNAVSQKLLQSNSFPQFLIVTLVLGVLPAITEELFFRGVIQNNFKELTKNTLFAVILTSVFFSLMHFELYAFLPRFLLSLCLGLLLVATNNLWIPILCHFINNLCVCTFYYLHNLKIIPSSDSTTYSQHPILIILSGVILILFFFHLYKLKRRIK